MIDAQKVNYRDVVEIMWGEPNGGSRRPVVERHQQTIVCATVAGSPVESKVREGYRQPRDAYGDTQTHSHDAD